MKSAVPVIVGCGKTGVSCARHLTKHGIPFAMTDSREHPPEYTALRQLNPNIQISCGSFDQELMQQASELIVSQGVSLNEQSIVACRHLEIPIIGDVELFARQVQAPVIAITGSNGKTTVTSLLTMMADQAGCQVKTGGNIGIPVLDLLNDNTPDFYIVEVSNFQLQMTYSLRPEAATILNVTPDHMDQYDNFEAYAATKQRVYRYCACAVINRQDFLTEVQNSKPERLISFGLDEPEAGQFGVRYQQDEPMLAYGSEPLLALRALPLQGQQHVANALAALALGTVMGLPLVSMLDTLKHFEGLAHRCQKVASIQGVDWFNDSKGTNVGATIAAIKSIALDGLIIRQQAKLVLIAGGRSKNADFTELKTCLNQHVSDVILFGEAAAEMEKTFSSLLTKTHRVNDLNAAVGLARTVVKKGGGVLFSPACSSFDMFRNYVHRGEVFCQLVKDIADA